MTIGKLSGQCDFGQKGQSYCNQRGQSCVAKRVKVAWLFHIILIRRKINYQTHFIDYNFRLNILFSGIFRIVNTFPGHDSRGVFHNKIPRYSRIAPVTVFPAPAEPGNDDCTANTTDYAQQVFPPEFHTLPTHQIADAEGRQPACHKINQPVHHPGIQSVTNCR